MERVTIGVFLPPARAGNDGDNARALPASLAQGTAARIVREWRSGGNVADRSQSGRTFRFLPDEPRRPCR